MRFEIGFSGHQNIRSLHQKTIEITKDSSLTPRGDCIVGVGANFGCKEIPNSLKKKLQNPLSVVKFLIKVKNCTFGFVGSGHEDLILDHPDDIVLRKSSYICPRTLAIKCSKASDEIPREIIKLLQDPQTKGILSIDVL